jgi:hypothetical protein
MSLPRADGQWIVWDSKNLQNACLGPIESAVLGVQILYGLSVSSVEGGGQQIMCPLLAHNRLRGRESERDAWKVK